jgi:hypothetical protein
MNDEPPGKRRLCGAYMLCCTCEVNDNFVALQHGGLTCHFRIFPAGYSSAVNHVFHTLYV